MKRVKQHKIKIEKAECSSQQRDIEEHDLAYYIHDRVELMHQVFSMLKYKELKSMAPECVRNLAIGDLQELCTEELLGISSKRLLAILDGAEPPSDTESSSPSPPPDQLETISLDSISSDEELLATSSKKKKHKHRHHGSKPKSKKKEKQKQPETQAEENSELSKASRAGLTVLELLELQARARAIRAQLQQEQANRIPSETTAVESSHHSSDNEVEIKEEPADVVEISSEDEKPDIDQLQQNIGETKTTPEMTNTDTVKEPETQLDSQTVTKRINDLVITVPHTIPTRKIKLNRNKVTVSVTNDSSSAPTEMRSVAVIAKDVPENFSSDTKTKSKKSNENKLKKRKKDKQKKAVEKEGSDHDEITLQLSDSEKMDLLEDLDESRKNYDKVSSSSDDTESSSSDSGDENATKETQNSVIKVASNSLREKTDKIVSKNILVAAPPPLLDNIPSINNPAIVDCTDLNNLQIIKESNNTTSKEGAVRNDNQDSNDKNEKRNQNTSNNLNKEEKVHSGNSNSDQNSDVRSPDATKENFVGTDNDNLRVITNTNESSSVTVVGKPLEKELNIFNDSSKSVLTDEKVMEFSSIEEIPLLNDIEINVADKDQEEDSNKETKENENVLSDGEISDCQSSEVETIDVQPEVVCISDEDGFKNKVSKKKKKKEKKSKKDKRIKKHNSDFREAADQNFYSDANIILNRKNEENVSNSCSNETNILCNRNPINLDSDDVYEILELSDDSSCYEVEGTVLSKEPTAEEIEALSAKIDEIERVEVVTDEQIREHEEKIAEKKIAEQNDDSIDTTILSWKDRYLGSKKVKKVLTTANILNALRKKNKELKKKIEDSKKLDDKKTSNEPTVPKEIGFQLEDGSIEQYNTLLGSTKYVDPIKEPLEEKTDAENKDEVSGKLVIKESEEMTITKEMKKDAKQLLKMYKRLLKHNDMNKQKDPNKKKKKKQKKKDTQNNEITRS